MNITIPDYSVAKHDDYLMIKIYDMTIDITDIEMNVPENDDIDAAMMTYKYTFLDGCIPDDIPEELLKQWLNYIVTDELNESMNGR